MIRWSGPVAHSTRESVGNGATGKWGNGPLWTRTTDPGLIRTVL